MMKVRLAHMRGITHETVEKTAGCGIVAEPADRFGMQKEAGTCAVTDTDGRNHTDTGNNTGTDTGSHTDTRTDT